MAFTDLEIAEHTVVIEQLLWTHRRPPLRVRDQVREGQRFTGHAIEFFFVRPAYRRPGEFSEESIAKVQYVRSRGVWRLYWKRADGKWHSYVHQRRREVGRIESGASRHAGAVETGCRTGRGRAINSHPVSVIPSKKYKHKEVRVTAVLTDEEIKLVPGDREIKPDGSAVLFPPYTRWHNNLKESIYRDLTEAEDALVEQNAGT